MDNADEILERIELKNEDLNNLGSDLTHKIFSSFTVKEISLLCNVNVKFNTICRRESLWREKVLSDYGVKRKYGKSWRKTAINMFKVNMINLGNKWLNGQTYEEILEQGLKENNGWKYIRKLQLDALYETVEIKIIPEDEIDYDYHREEVYRFYNLTYDVQLTEKQLDDHDMIFNREISIIHLVVTTLSLNNLNLPGLEDNPLFADTQLIMGIFPISYIIDPVFYIMEFSVDDDEYIANRLGYYYAMLIDQ